MKKQVKISLYIILCLVILVGGYSGWNTVNPEYSCSSCHEISPSVETNQHSSHRNIACVECHGTALSNGIHSLAEKVNMLFTHFSDNKKNEEIRLSELQIVDIMERCQNCHRDEYADWKSGGHSVTYEQIFLDEKHNKMEIPYEDCFRCHGMFYEGNIGDLMTPVDTKGPWKLKDKSYYNIPVIPCLGCHEIHSRNEPRVSASETSDPKSLFYTRDERNVHYGWYVRADRIMLRADKLLKTDMYDGGKSVATSDDYSQRVCVQCHSSNYMHEAGTEDDRTPTGVHEGLSCNACHMPHSNKSRQSCDNCHPAYSNCGLDVKKMNTSFADKDSPFNIHHVDCSDCHPGRKSKRVRK